MKIQKTVFWSLILALALVESAAGRLIPATAFTYQGRVNDNGVPANGVYDFQFTIYDSTNNPGVVLAGPITNAATGVSNGLFTVQLDFGSDIFNESIRWLDIAVRTNGASTFTELTPRQQITPTPYAIAAQNALNADIVQATGVIGTLGSSQLPANVVTNGASGVNIGGTLSGNGAGVTNVSAYSLAEFTFLTGWGYNASGQTSVPAGLDNVVAAAAGDSFSLAVKIDGTVVAWGDNSASQTSVPAGLSNVVAVAAGDSHSLALKSDGTVVAWGDNVFGETTVPAGLSNVVAVAAGEWHSLALKSDGRVVGWGYNIYGQTKIPAGLSNVVAIGGGEGHSLALKSDGTVVAWGDGSFGQTNVPPGLSNVVAVAAGGNFNLALKIDGTVVAWGYDADGETNVPAGLSNVVAVAAGDAHSLALKRDGTIVAWGDDSSGEINVPAGLTNVIAIASGSIASHSFAFQERPAVAFSTGDNTFNGNQTINGNTTIVGNQTILGDQFVAGSQTISSNLTIGSVDSQAPLQMGVNASGTGWVIGHNTAAGGYTALIGGLSSPMNGYGYLQSVRASGIAIGDIILNPDGGNVGIGNTNPANLLVVGSSVSPAYCNGTTWVNGSDRNAKQDFAAINPDAVLEKISAMPITEWTYKVDTDGTRHMGPMAQDFHAAFGLNGSDDKHIATVDESGVALAAIQGLNQKVDSGAEKAEARIHTLESENADLKARVEALEKLILQQKSR